VASPVGVSAPDRALFRPRNNGHSALPSIEPVDYSSDMSDGCRYGRTRFSSARTRHEGGIVSLRRSRISIAAVMSASLLAGLAVSDSGSATTPDTTLPGTGDGPVGVIAIGHSGLTAENSDPERPHQPALENSWATGTNPDVNSIYQRLIEVHPETEGHVANTARGGAHSSTLASQAETALDEVPTPELVIIQTIDGDMNSCPVDEGEVASFGDNVSKALDLIVDRSPQSRILMVTGFIRPDPAYDEQAIAAHPELEAEATGTPGECGTPFLSPGEVNMAFFDMLTTRIEAFEAEQQRRCDAVPQCSTDSDVRAPFFFTLEYETPTLDHPSVLGLAKRAELEWPVVVDVLQLDASEPVSSTNPAD